MSRNFVTLLEIPSRHLRINGPHHGHRVPEVILRTFVQNCAIFEQIQRTGYCVGAGDKIELELFCWTLGQQVVSISFIDITSNRNYFGALALISSLISRAVGTRPVKSTLPSSASAGVDITPNLTISSILSTIPCSLSNCFFHFSVVARCRNSVITLSIVSCEHSYSVHFNLSSISCVDSSVSSSAISCMYALVSSGVRLPRAIVYSYNLYSNSRRSQWTN